MDETNHHLWKPVMIGEVQANGQFSVVWKTSKPIRAQPWSPYIPAMRSVPSADDACSHCSCCHGDGGRAGEAAPPEPRRPPSIRRRPGQARQAESREETIASLVEATDVHALPILVRSWRKPLPRPDGGACWSTGKARSRMRSPVLRHRSTESSWSR